MLLLLGQLALATVAGLTAAYAAAHWTTDAYYETALLRVGAASLGTVIATCALTDAAVANRAGR